MRQNLMMLCAIGAGFTIIPASGVSAKDEAELPPVFANVLECRTIAEAAARLACFDTSVAALEQANDSKSVVVLTEESVKETRRGLFGLSLPKLGLFKDDDETAELKEVTAKIATVRGGDGRWVLTLEDGAVWEQTDGVYLRTPRAGQNVTIKRAALGSFKAKVEGGLGFRIKRVN